MREVRNSGDHGSAPAYMVLSCDSAVDLMESKAEWKASYAVMSEGRSVGCSVVEAWKKDLAWCCRAWRREYTVEE